MARPAGQAATPAPAPPSADFTAPPPSKRPLAVVGLVLGAFVVLGITVSVVQAALFSPKATVRAFFADLADGDASSAKKRLDVVTGASPDGSRSYELLSDDVLSAKTYVAPTDVEVTDVEEAEGQDDQARVTVSYVLDGEQKSARLSLDRSEDRTLLFFRSWRIDDGTATLALPVGVPYQVNGVATADRTPPAGSEGGTDDTGTDAVVYAGYAVFPGRYDIGVAENPLLSGEGKQATVALDSEPVQVSLSTTIEDDAKAEVEKQVRAYIDECAKETVAQPENCPFGTYLSSEARNVQWSVVTYPKIEFHQAPGGSVYIQTGEDGSGTATVSYESKSYFSDKYERRTSTSGVAVGGRVVVKDGKIDWLSPKDYAQENGGG